MSESASAALAWRSAAAASSAGTRLNSRPDASQIQASSISNGFSSSCTLCRLRARRTPRCSHASASMCYGLAGNDWPARITSINTPYCTSA